MCHEEVLDSTFNSLFQRTHPDVFEVYNNPAAQKAQPRFQRENTVTINSCLSGQYVLSLIVEYIIGSFSPFCTVENVAFKNMIHGLTGSQSVHIPSRRTVTREIESLYEEKVKELRDVLSQVNFVATTADIWTGFKNRRAFMGMTVTFLDNELNRKSFTFSCRLFEGSHTFDRIGAILQEEHVKFGLFVPKLVATVTDNASNFKKAFKEYGILLGDLNEDSSATEEVEEEEEEEENCLSAASIFDERNRPNDGIVLPPQLNCSAHTLSLVSVNGLKDAENESASFKQNHRKLMGKLSALWNKVSRSPAASEHAYKLLKKRFTTPCQTRWNSLFDAILFAAEQDRHFGANFRSP